MQQVKSIAFKCQQSLCKYLYLCMYTYSTYTYILKTDIADLKLEVNRKQKHAVTHRCHFVPAASSHREAEGVWEDLQRKDAAAHEQGSPHPRCARGTASGGDVCRAVLTRLQLPARAPLKYTLISLFS